MAGNGSIAGCGTCSNIFLTSSCATDNSPDPPQVGQGSAWVPVLVIVIVLPPPHRQHLVMKLPSKRAGANTQLLLRPVLFIQLPASPRLRQGEAERAGILPSVFLWIIVSFPVPATLFSGSIDSLIFAQEGQTSLGRSQTSPYWPGCCRLLRPPVSGRLR